jgi:hypothetical protein
MMLSINPHIATIVGVRVGLMTRHRFGAVFIFSMS